jgi:hypothetical protein
VGQIANYEYENFHGFAVESVRDEDGKKNYVAFAHLPVQVLNVLGTFVLNVPPSPFPSLLLCCRTILPSRMMRS